MASQNNHHYATGIDKDVQARQRRAVPVLAGTDSTVDKRALELDEKKKQAKKVALSALNSAVKS